MGIGRFRGFKDEGGRRGGGSGSAEEVWDDGDNEEDEQGEELIEDGRIGLGLGLCCLCSSRSWPAECLYTYTRTAKLSAKWSYC